MQDCIYDCLDYYTKTFVFVLNNGMGKLRLIDAFGESYLFINFILYKDNNYAPDNTKILQFILLEPQDKVKESINKLLQKKLQL